MPTDLFTPPRITLIALLNSTSHLILFTHEEILTTRPQWYSGWAQQDQTPAVLWPPVPALPVQPEVYNNQTEINDLQPENQNDSNEGKFQNWEGGSVVQVLPEASRVSTAPPKL